MNSFRLPAHLPGLLLLVVATADCSQGGHEDPTASSLSFGRSILGEFQDWEAGVLRLDGVSVCHARTTSTSHLVGGEPWPAPAELRVTEGRFDLKVVGVGREDGWEVAGAAHLSGSELARHLEALEAEMGADGWGRADDERSGTQVRIRRGFWLGRYEVTHGLST